MMAIDAQGENFRPEFFTVTPILEKIPPNPISSYRTTATQTQDFIFIESLFAMFVKVKQTARN